MFPQGIDVPYNLISIGPVVSEENMFQSVDGRRTMTDLDGQQSIGLR